MRPLHLEMTISPIDGASKGGVREQPPRKRPPATGGPGPYMPPRRGPRPRSHPPRPRLLEPAPPRRPAGPDYPWSRGKSFLFCVQHGGEEGADQVPYPVLVHDEDGHRGEPCQGPGHTSPGAARHVLANSAIAAVAYALGVNEQQARAWWERGWVLVEGRSARPGAAPPPGGALTIRNRPWHDPTGRALLAPPGRPRPEERSYVPIQWCVRAPADLPAPFPAQVHACQDHQGRPCYPPAPWLPPRHHHLHVVAKSPSGAICRALGMARKTAKRIAAREGALLLEGETAARFAQRRPQAAQREPPPPPPEEPPAQAGAERVPEAEACLSKGISVSLHVEAPWSCC